MNTATNSCLNCGSDKGNPFCDVCSIAKKGYSPCQHTQSILSEAENIVSGDRNNDYGPPIEDFKRTAKMWSAILNTDVTPNQFALCMIAVKISRECHKHKRDNLVDIAGYAETINMMENI